MTVFVVGTGRSGTSTIARLLHERLNVSMGGRFRAVDDQNPDGYYEDLDFKEANEKALNGKMRVPVFVETIEHLASQRTGKWGLKDPRLCYLLGFYLRLMPDAVVIRTRRELSAVAESLSRCYGWPLANALHEAHRRESFLDRYESHLVSFDHKRTDESLLEELTPCLH